MKQRENPKSINTPSRNERLIVERAPLPGRSANKEPILYRQPRSNSPPALLSLVHPRLKGNKKTRGREKFDRVSERKMESLRRPKVSDPNQPTTLSPLPRSAPPQNFFAKPLKLLSAHSGDSRVLGAGLFFIYLFCSSTLSPARVGILV